MAPKKSEKATFVKSERGRQKNFVRFDSQDGAGNVVGGIYVRKGTPLADSEKLTVTVTGS